MVKALADRLAEALAEKLHKQAREDWGYGRGESLTDRGADPREVPRHPAGARLPGLPRPHREARCSSTCSTPSSAAGIALTESFAMLPAAAVSGFYFAHPEARYFQVGRIGRDQVLDYHRRKGMDLRTRRALAGAEPRLRARSGHGLALRLLGRDHAHDPLVRRHREAAVVRVARRGFGPLAELGIDGTQEDPRSAPSSRREPRCAGPVPVGSRGRPRRWRGGAGTRR